MKTTKQKKYVLFNCSCGSQFALNVSEKANMEKTVNVFVCLNCHPFTTNKNKIIGDNDRIKKFMQKYKMSKKDK